MDSSNIIYFKEDNEANDIPQEDTCLFFFTKKFKRDRFPKTDDIASPAKRIKLHKNISKKCMPTYKYLRKSNNCNDNVSKKFQEMAFNEIYILITFNFFLRI